MPCRIEHRQFSRPIRRRRGLPTRSPHMSEYDKIRINMVDCQLRPNKISDPALLDAFLQVPREAFVPLALKGAAYVDEDLPLGEGRYLLEPMVLGRLLQTAVVGPNDVVLEIGCATGYATAILGRLARSVVAIESDSVLARQAKANLAGQRNATVFEQRLDRGYPERAPYDVIVIGGAVGDIPPAVLDQLAEGGRLVTVIETRAGQLGEAVLLERGPTGISRRRLFEAGIHTLPGFQAEPSFVF
ncbi:MAG: protein-L-isoaspartate(D-aspartate) O-methyltransferase [Aliidongia sp.]|jgi:protein-L-isoaspartate(D-aspartate) O-methyltransferase|nr:protein-L-isoaspartate(D-aspartate) O-methyltransferase [Aliidongia sp.]